MWLIDWIEFYAVSAIFQPCNGGKFMWKCSQETSRKSISNFHGKFTCIFSCEFYIKMNSCEIHIKNILWNSCLAFSLPQYITNMTTPLLNNPCPGRHEIYNFSRPYIGHHYYMYILNLCELCLGVEKKIFNRKGKRCCNQLSAYSKTSLTSAKNGKKSNYKFHWFWYKKKLPEDPATVWKTNKDSEFD